MPQKDKNGLTHRQEKFCKEIAKGNSQVGAYVAAGYDKGGTYKTHKEAASRMAKQEMIQKRLKQLQEQVDKKALASLEQIAADLLSIAIDEEKPDSIRLKAYDQLAKLQGGYSDNVTLTTNISGGITIDDKREAIKELLGD